MTTGRRLVVMLDNAVSAAQVRPLLPGAGASLVVVTSRHRLTGLVVDGARFLDVDPLGEPGALELLEHLIGPDRIGAEPGHARSLVALCGTLPLAVCASGARLAARRRWPIARAVAELGDEARRLAALRTGEGDISVNAVFNTSYQALDPEHAAAYRLLGVHPGPDLSVPAAAALIGTDEDRAADLLHDLADASLLVEGPGDRYGFHDLVRLRAGRVPRPGPRGRLHPPRRLVPGDHGHRRPHPDAGTLAPGRPLRVPAGRPLRIPSGGPGGSNGSARTGGGRAAAPKPGCTPSPGSSSEAMWPLFLQRKHYPSWIRMYELGLTAAESCDDLKAQARMLEGLGVAHLNLQDFDTATRHYETALVLERRAGHRLGEATALEGLGVAALATGAPSRAVELFTLARDVHIEQGRPRGIALMDRHIGEASAWQAGTPRRTRR